jgi:hypothetical protein
MERDLKSIQSKVSDITIKRYKSLHTFAGVPRDFFPWKSNLSPSALYNCSLPLRKKSNIKTPETKWVSIKRWSMTTSLGIELPDGVFYSIKRAEKFLNDPDPHFEKTEFALILLPYGNVFSQSRPDVPITEDWLFKEFENKLMLERLMDRDAAKPIAGYFKSVYDFMNANPDQIGIHLRRKTTKKAS